MANPALDRLFAPGVLAMPATPTNPIQNPLDPAQQQALFAAQAEQRAKDTQLKQQLLRAAVLKSMTDPDQVKGGGPAGIRIGQGPGGWAVSLGDLGAAIVRAKALKKGGEGVIQATGELGPSEQALAEQIIRSSPGGLFDTGYARPQPSYVPQGSPLMGMSDPLALNMKY